MQNNIAQQEEVRGMVVLDHIADVSKKVERTAESAQNTSSCAHENDLVSRKAAIEAINGMIDRFERLLADIRESKVDDSVCGMCEYDGAYMGQSGDWCNECPGFDKDNCFKLSDRCRKRWMGDIVLPSAQPDNQTNLCDSCDCSYPDCPSKYDDVIFGNGIGNDNICACSKYKPSAQPERKTGRWVDDTYCSECGWVHTTEPGFIGSVRGFNFCPNCGADMRGEQDEAD